MPRRLLASLMTALLVLLTLASCGGAKGSEKAISAGKSAVEVADQYLDGDISADKARDKISVLSSSMDYVSDQSSEDENHVEDLLISAGITILESSILSDSIKDDSESFDKVLEARNDLAKSVGENKR